MIEHRSYSILYSINLFHSTSLSLSLSFSLSLSCRLWLSQASEWWCTTAKMPTVGQCFTASPTTGPVYFLHTYRMLMSFGIQGFWDCMKHTRGFLIDGNMDILGSILKNSAWVFFIVEDMQCIWVWKVFCQLFGKCFLQDLYITSWALFWTFKHSRVAEWGNVWSVTADASNIATTHEKRFHWLLTIYVHRRKWGPISKSATQIAYSKLQCSFKMSYCFVAEKTTDDSFGQGCDQFKVQAHPNFETINYNSTNFYICVIYDQMCPILLVAW